MSGEDPTAVGPGADGGAALPSVEPSATVDAGDPPGALTAPRRLVAAGPDPAPAVEASEPGGEPACFLHRVCAGCGRVADSEPPTTCPGCGRELQPG